MTRVVIGSQLGSSAGPVQFFTSERPLIQWAHFRPRSGNSTVTYLGTSSGFTSSEGLAFSSGSDSVYGYERGWTVEAPIKATTFWMRGDSTSRIDWSVRYED